MFIYLSPPAADNLIKRLTILIVDPSTIMYIAILISTWVGIKYLIMQGRVASSKTAISGSLIAIPAPKFGRHPDPHGFTLTDPSTGETTNYSTIYGGIVVLDGSGSFDQVATQQFVTESVETTTLVEDANSPVPFRHGGSKGGHNLRNQTVDGHYDTFKP